MARRRTPSPLDWLQESPQVQQAARALVDAVIEEARERTLDAKSYRRALAELARLRARELHFPALSSGHGRGARVRLADGTWKLDFVGGIGVLGLGHGDRDLLETAVVAAASDTVFQGHLLPGPEYLRLARALVRHAGRRLRHVWLSVSGAMANENALKLIFHHHHPADRVVAFEGGFAGRTMALAEITDRPEQRRGLPLRGHVLFVPFYDRGDPRSLERSLAALEGHLTRYPGGVAGMIFELVQGEAGVRTAPREFFATLMERCRSAGIAVWVDEVQTFARTGELFAYRTLGLEDYVDVVTVGKMLQASAVLFRKAYAPSPGLLGGTFAGATVGLAVGARLIERLENEGYLGPEGRVAVLARRVERRFDSISKRLPHAVHSRDGVGSMHSFVAFDGSAEVTEAVLQAAFEEGVVLLAGGRCPTRIRMLLPLNVTDAELEAGFSALEKALRRVAEERGLAC